MRWLAAAAAAAAACCWATSPAVVASTNSTCEGRGIGCLVPLLDNSWVRKLSEDPAAAAHAPNKRAREVLSGHFVRVAPTPLPQPILVATSREMATELGLLESDLQLDSAVRLLSGDAAAVPGFEETWATPYALSIYGKKFIPGGSGKNGDGYGDGRAISIGEVVVPSSGARWELQLKGGGRTPFARNADGRAVLRSSVREFLASEAMHSMGVATTRALSLVVSRTEKSRRPWYSNKTAEFETRRAEMAAALSQASAPAPPDIVQMEACAITCRVSNSFLRVGHFELFARRARDADASVRATGLAELKALAAHALQREFSDQLKHAEFQEQVVGMAREAAQRFARLGAEWIRVGYTQSNFNADNCLISGATVDYGPFGFIEKYSPGWGMWISAGDHFSFMNQPVAMGKNLGMFLNSLEPLVNAKGVKELQAISAGYAHLSDESLRHMWCAKLGLQLWDGPTGGGVLWRQLEQLMRESAVDWTLFWRQLAVVAAATSDDDDGLLMEPLQLAFYSPPTWTLQQRWTAWLRQWRGQQTHEGVATITQREALADRMRQASPKYVPREWMLAEAYTAAAEGDHTVVHRLQELFRRPYDEQSEFESRYYRRAPDSVTKQGGIAFMS